MEELSMTAAVNHSEASETIVLAIASNETKGGGAYPQPDTNQPSRQAFGIQDD